jgi:nicotinate-nucleotide adenylyltransferase
VSTSIHSSSYDAHRRPRAPSIWPSPRPILGSVHGILGGTFDPPHIGHLAVAAAAYDQLDIDLVRFVPAGFPWQKRHEFVSDGTHRLAMTRLAAAEDRHFIVDEIEMLRDGPSYMIDTVEELESGTGERCMLILGADAAMKIPTWHRSDELLEAVDIAVVPRPGADHAAVSAALGRPVVDLSMPMVDLSGTQIRAHVKAGHTPRFLVPDAVCDYIEHNRLYG